MKYFKIDHHQRTVEVYLPEDKKWIGFKFDAPMWEALIKEFNNPPDIGIEVTDAAQIKEEFFGN